MKNTSANNRCLPGLLNPRCTLTAQRRHRLFFWGGLTLAFALRIWALLALNDSVYSTSLLWDEAYYHEWAQAILGNTHLADSLYEYAPLPAYFMALLYKLFAPEVAYIRYANIVLGTGACWLIYMIGKELTGKWYGLAALFCAALCKPLIFFSVVVLKTSLSVFLFAVLVYLVLINRRDSRWWNRIFTGVAFGLIFNVRPNVLILLPILPFLLCSFSEQRLSYLKNLLKTGFFFTIGLILSVTPFVLPSYLAGGSLQLTPLQSGFLLYANNNLSNPSPYYQPVSFASSHPGEQGIQFTIEASRRTGKKMTTGEAADFWRSQVLMNIVESPWYWCKKMGWKLLSFLNFTEVDDHYHTGFISSVVPWFSYPFLPYWLFFLFGMTGLSAGLLQKRQRYVLWPLAVIVSSYAATLVIYSTGSRFQLPLLVILIPATVFTGKELFSLLQASARKRVSVYLFFLMLFLVSGLLPVKGGGAMAGHYNTYAFLLDKNGQEDKAVRWWEKSVGLHEPYSAYAHLFLSGKYYQLYGVEKAIATLEQIPDQSFAAASKYAALGDIRLHHGSLAEAEKLYRTSLNINSGQRRVRKELIRIMRHTKDSGVEKEIKQLDFITSFYN